jgi:hypothetical protein
VSNRAWSDGVVSEEGALPHVRPSPTEHTRREKAKARLRFLTRGAIVTATGATVADGAVNLVRSALHVFADDLGAHVNGMPCARWNRSSELRFPDVTRAA